jgi:hypothetical protein
MRDEQEGKVRFRRAQKYRLSAKGAEAVAAYATVIEGAQSGTGRACFDAARQAWSEPRGLTSEDGLFLGEFGGGDKTLAEATRSLESCGTSPRELKAAVERLLGCGMLEPVPEPVRPAPPPRHHYW